MKKQKDRGSAPAPTHELRLWVRWNILNPRYRGKASSVWKNKFRTPGEQKFYQQSLGALGDRFISSDEALQYKIYFAEIGDRAGQLLIVKYSERSIRNFVRKDQWQ